LQQRVSHKKTVEFYNKNARTFVPDGKTIEEAISRTTYLGIAAHQDDLEIMCPSAIIECFSRTDKFFTGVVLTNGSGSPRSGRYANFSDGSMRELRIAEQEIAAKIGRYSAVIQLDYPSSEIKKPSSNHVIDDLIKIVSISSPQTIFTHSLFDKHETHVAAALRTISAIRKSCKTFSKLIGCEVWGSLDWLPDSMKEVLDCSGFDNLLQALISVYDSQIGGGKRYDLAAIGRRLSNATFLESHEVDKISSAVIGIDMSSVVINNQDVLDFCKTYIDKFYSEISSRINRLSK